MARAAGRPEPTAWGTTTASPVRRRRVATRPGPPAGTVRTAARTRSPESGSTGSTAAPQRRYQQGGVMGQQGERTGQGGQGQYAQGHQQQLGQQQSRRQSRPGYDRHQQQDRGSQETRGGKDDEANRGQQDTRGTDVTRGARRTILIRGPWTNPVTRRGGSSPRTKTRRSSPGTVAHTVLAITPCRSRLCSFGAGPRSLPTDP